MTEIGIDAFKGCTGLTEIIIPDSVKIIHWNAFYGCTGLKNITIPSSVTKIGDSAFYEIDNVNYTGTATENKPWGAKKINGQAIN